MVRLVGRVIAQGTQGLARQLIESGSFRRVQLPDELPAHPRAPEASDVIGDAGDGILPRLGAEEIPDIVRHLHQMLCTAHGLLSRPAAARSPERSGPSLRRASAPLRWAAP